MSNGTNASSLRLCGNENEAGERCMIYADHACRVPHIYPSTTGAQWAEAKQKHRYALDKDKPCRVCEYDGAFMCSAHGRQWGAIAYASGPCPGWSAALSGAREAGK